MTMLAQCDRCKRIDKSKSDYAVIYLDENMHWDICPGCKRDFEVFIKNMNVSERKAGV